MMQTLEAQPAEQVGGLSELGPEVVCVICENNVIRDTAQGQRVTADSTATRTIKNSKVSLFLEAGKCHF